MTETVMLTGATGYLGRQVLDELLRAGYRVRALVRDPTKLGAARDDALTQVPGDLLDPGAVAAAARDVDAILHVAGQVGDWNPDASSFERVNVEGTQNVLAAARECGVRRVIATSTIMTLGPTDGLHEGTERTTPPNRPHLVAYQHTKARALAVCRAARGDDLDVAVVFPAALYGEGALSGGNYLVRVMHDLETGGYALLPRTEGLRWCLAHVADVARGHLLAVQRGDPNGEYILGAENVSFERMLEIMRDGLALASLPRRVPGWALLCGLRILGAWHGLKGTAPPMSVGGGRALLCDWAFSSARARRELGYEPRPFEPAFEKFVRWYVQKVR